MPLIFTLILLLKNAMTIRKNTPINVIYSEFSDMLSRTFFEVVKKLGWKTFLMPPVTYGNITESNPRRLHHSEISFNKAGYGIQISTSIRMVDYLRYLATVLGFEFYSQC